MKKIEGNIIDIYNNRDRQRIFDFDQYRQNPYLQSLSIDPLSD